jgi:hypothetical protein
MFQNHIQSLNTTPLFPNKFAPPMSGRQTRPLSGMHKHWEILFYVMPKALSLPPSPSPMQNVTVWRLST